MVKLFILLALSLLNVVAFEEGRAQNTIYIKVGDAKLKKSLTAIAPLQLFSTSSSNPDAKKIGIDLYKVIVNDLDVSGYFEFIKEEAFLEDATSAGLKPLGQAPNGFDFKNWKSIQTEFLIKAGYTVVKDQIEFEAYLYFVPQEKLVFAKKYMGSGKSVRRIAHTFCNDVLEKLTGKAGMFLSKFVAAQEKNGKFKEIVVGDWDGHNIDEVSSHRSVAFSPSWSPDNKSIIYSAFAFHTKQKSRNPDLFLYELDSKKRYLVSSRKGMNSGATFTPDGKHILLTVSQDGNPDIYKMTAEGESLVRLTNGPGSAINVEPTMNPQNDRIAFSSNRSGDPMIYTMSALGGDLKRITFAGKYNSSPSWSPDGKKIAFAGYDRTHYDIFIMNADGTSLERLTSATKPNGRMADNEDPSFSPDGRMVMFSSNRTMNNQIYIINIDGTGERRITVDKDKYFRPKWSKNF